MAGASYGGAVSLLAAGYDQRVDAIAPAITYWNLADALFPDGVFKKLWAGIFFNQAGGGRRPLRDPRVWPRCTNGVADVAGAPDAAARELLEARSARPPSPTASRSPR